VNAATPSTITALRQKTSLAFTAQSGGNQPWRL